MLLYDVFSIMPDEESAGTVEVHWVNIYNKRVDYPYGEIIKDFNEMTPEDQSRYETYVRYLFTSEEVKALSHFLEENLNCNLEVYKIIDLSKPLKEQDCPVRNGRFDNAFFEINIFWLENYNLPFELIGFYDPFEGCPVIESLPYVNEFYKMANPD